MKRGACSGVASTLYPSTSSLCSSSLRVQVEVQNHKVPRTVYILKKLNTRLFKIAKPVTDSVQYFNISMASHKSVSNQKCVVH